MSREFAELKEELARLQSAKEQFGREIEALRERLACLERGEGSVAPQAQKAPPERPSEPVAVAEAESIGLTQQPVSVAPTPAAQEMQGDDSLQQQAPWLGSRLFELVIAQLIGPFSQLWGMTREFYDSYQRRGMGHVFLLMVAGLITMTVGVGYLLQYSYNHLLSDISRLAVGFVLANLILGIGVSIVARRPRQQEYGSALVGLGIVINYLACYVGANYYQLLSPAVTLGLQALITLAGYGLAYRLNTKIVAMIALVGGTLAPLLLGTELVYFNLYLPYLLLLAILSIGVSHKQGWPLFMVIAAALQIAVLESLVYVSRFDGGYGVMLSLHLLFYAYILYTLSCQQKIQLPLLATLITFFILLVIQISEGAGVILAINGLLWAGLFVLLSFTPKASVPFILTLVFSNKLLRQFSLVFGGSLIAFAALLLLDPYLQGIVWGLEGVLLLWIGLEQRLYSIRSEAYLLLVIGLGATLVAIGKWLMYAPFYGLGFHPESALIALLVTTFIWIIARELLLRSSLKWDRFEAFVKTLLCEAIGFLEVGLLYLVGMQLLGDYALNLAPLAMALLLWHSVRYRLRIVELAGWFQLLVLVAGIAYSVNATDSLRFSEQLLLGQIALVELLALMFLSCEFYRRLYPGSWFKPHAEALRIAFYLLVPLLYLPKMIRSWPELLPLALCLSTGLSLLFSQISRHKLLRLESTLLSYLMMLVIAISCWEMSGYGVLALLIALLFYASLIGLNRLEEKVPGNLPGYHLWPTLSHHFRQSYYFFALVILVLVYGVLGSWSLGLALVAGYFWLILNIRPRPLALRGSLYLNYGLALLFSVATLGWHLMSLVSARPGWFLPMLADLIVLGMSGMLLYRARPYHRLDRVFLSYPWQLFGWNLGLAVGYFIWSYQLPLWGAAPLSSILLVCHGCGLLFLSLKDRLAGMAKLALGFFVLACGKILLLDLSSFDILQKIIVFMVIGALLLVISYQYMRLKSRQAIRDT
ncbi:DUF2339 domain-containing protein [Dongshaea marina]|uniref:DUF2339 domain-containing protein n=1 Tax=Dongshaea marina TaxID=2047966 RepID=UPI000D3E81EA|nr:DUF2339 domain-containing protein [Dongshaea marina]